MTGASSNSQPRISVNIPTLNSAKTLAVTLSSVINQGHTNVELIVIDNGSRDFTRSVARDYGAAFIENPGSLLQSRCLGIEQSSGNYILLLDSDQILRPSMFSRAIERLQHADYLYLEEGSSEGHGKLSGLYEADRRSVQKSDRRDRSGPPRNALPRFFKSDLIRAAIKSIPNDVRKSIIYRDHAVITYETTLLSQRWSWLDDAVVHSENSNLGSLVRKHYIYGIDDWCLAGSSRYRELVISKHFARARVGRTFASRDNAESLLLSLAKLGPYVLGVMAAAFNAPNAFNERGKRIRIGEPI